MKNEKGVTIKHLRESIQAARELCYGEECIKKLKLARNDYDIDNILIDYRNKERGYMFY